MPAVLSSPITQMTGLRRPSESRVEFSGALIKRAYMADVEAMARYLISMVQGGVITGEQQLSGRFRDRWVYSGWVDNPYAAMVVAFSNHRDAWSTLPANVGQPLAGHAYLWGYIAQEASWFDLWDKINALSVLRMGRPETYAAVRLSTEQDRQTAAAVQSPFGGPQLPPAAPRMHWVGNTATAATYTNY